MFDDPRRWYCQGFSLQIEAIEDALEARSRGEVDAAEAIQRIARLLEDAGAGLELRGVRGAAAWAAAAGEDEIHEAAMGLLRRLKAARMGPEAAVVRILVVESDGGTSEMVAEALENGGCEVVTAGTAAEAEAIVERESLALVVLDLVLPDMDGRNFLVRLRGRRETATVPVFVLAGLVGPRPRTECYALGADRIFEKPLDARELRSAAAASLQRAGQLGWVARRDPVTDFLTRAAFAETFRHQVNLSRRASVPLSLAVLAVERPQDGRRTQPVVGDVVVRHFAQVLSRCLREADVIARWGGDDYVAMFPATDVRGAALALVKAQTVLSEHVVIAADGTRVAVTFSAGVTAVPRGGTLEDAMAEGDRLLYVARSTGRHRVVTADDEPTPRARRIVLAEDDPVTAKLICHRLAREGFDVRHFTDGSEVLPAVGDGSDISLFVLDVKMPGLDGFQLLQRLRDRRPLARVPVLMLTSLGSEEDVVRAFEMGASDYMTKPFSSAELTARIHRLLKGYELPLR
jgi:diguanylate cyclase (GGDEF)-like protein